MLRFAVQDGPVRAQMFRPRKHGAQLAPQGTASDKHAGGHGGKPPSGLTAWESEDRGRRLRRGGLGRRPEADSHN